MDSVEFLYLKPGGTKLEPHRVSNGSNDVPPIPPGMVRVVTISDTHNETKNLKLPWGHILVHAGDVLTESGLRHVKQKKGGEKLEVTVTPYGTDLFTKFASWFGALPHPHKVLIAGNHDWVMQAMGSAEIVKVLEKYSVNPKSIAYLEHEEAVVGPVKVFGSPFAYWGSHNNAFMTKMSDYSSMTKDTHIMVTHYPAILPKEEGRFREDRDIVDAMVRCKTLLHVGGHCHWAHGLYLSSKKSIPCVVASVCDSKWQNPLSLVGKDRGDPDGDRWRGGYNVRFPPIVCDLPIPGGPPHPNDQWIKTPSTFKVELAIPFINPDLAMKPSLIFFGPNTDPDAIKRLVPKFQKYFDLSHFDDVEDAIAAVREKQTPFDVCVAKLGSTRNLGQDLMRVLFETSKKTNIIVHSSTAMGHTPTQQYLKQEFGVTMFVDYKSEKILMTELKTFCKNFVN
eukprot:Phypoly_transcript_07011.p1 GENE.Phypoly_transcript_07011~~Phypoly_transcript_07011.p1  ORF type:complete len:472 (+),score=62.51 Phypoly_transcript_07011:66-1418(+)